MSLTSCHVHFSPSNERIVHLSGSLLRSLQLSGKKTIQLKFGHETIHGRGEVHQRQGNHLYLSAGVRQSIKVPKAGSISFVQGRENELQLGPLIGVLTDGPSQATHRLGPAPATFASWSAWARTKAYFFAFTPRDINWQQETINGYFLNSSNHGWYRKVVPLPDVVYNRLPSREQKQQPPLCLFGRSLSAKRCHSLIGASSINPMFINCSIKT